MEGIHTGVVPLDWRVIKSLHFKQQDLRIFERFFLWAEEELVLLSRPYRSQGGKVGVPIWYTLESEQLDGRACSPQLLISWSGVNGKAFTFLGSWRRIQYSMVRYWSNVLLRKSAFITVEDLNSRRVALKTSSMYQRTMVKLSVRVLGIFNSPACSKTERIAASLQRNEAMVFWYIVGMISCEWPGSRISWPFCATTYSRSMSRRYESVLAFGTDLGKKRAAIW